jgi:CIC family chloride channel protein
LCLALLAGVGGAIGATIFHLAIDIGVEVFYGDGGNFITRVEEFSVWWRLLVPTLGGLLVGLLFLVAKVREAEGEGVPEVMEALALRQGTIRPVVAPVKILAATLTLSSGGSAGREGPVIQIGSAIGSSLAQWVGLPERERSLLLACGAAAAIGGAFGAPFAGVLFTIEILRHQPAFLRTGLVVTSALVGAGLTYVFTGYNGLSFLVPSLPVFGWWPYGVIAIALGAAAALTALLFGMVLRTGHLIGRCLPVPRWAKPAVGGFLIGVIALFMPYIHEPAAYPLMLDLVSMASLPIWFLFSLFILKMLATGLTLGTGGVGGIFAPSLLLGTILGSLLGAALVALGVLAPSAVPLLVLIGMAAVFAGAAHAPLTAALITYEMTSESGLVIPLLIACFSATFLARTLRHESIYEKNL